MLRTDRLASFRDLIQFTNVHPYLLKYNSYFQFTTQLDKDMHGQTGRSTVWANGTMRKIQEAGKFRPGINHIYHLWKLVPFSGKRQRSIKYGFEEKKHGFSFGAFRPKK